MSKVRQATIPFIILGLLGFWVVFLYLKYSPEDVLKNWKLTVPSGTYHAGDTVHVHNEVNKTKALKPIAHRNIECLSDGKFISYHLADVQGVNNNQGHISSNIDFVVPFIIPTKPATCRFSLVAVYKVNIFRTVIEYQPSNTFTVQ